MIQHSDQVTQEKYLPMMREAVKNGKAQGSSLALLEDRVALGQESARPTAADRRRPRHRAVVRAAAEIRSWMNAGCGLGTLAEYVKIWDMTWDAEAYLRELPALEERIKAQRP
ncbi:MAG: hypothetical protein IPN38_16860 [Flavobacteriales bacterium]|nr:hypothetical protein [Flavobacteriales bacterium]